MKKNRILSLFVVLALLAGCDDNTLEVMPEDGNFPYQLLLDADEGGDLADAEDYKLEVKFADYLPESGLPTQPVTIAFEISELEGSFNGSVAIDEIVYEVEVDGCTYERALEFSQQGNTGTITLAVDEDLKTVPESFEIVFLLPGEDDTEGGFHFEITSVQTTGNIDLGYPRAFDYQVLDNEVAGEWELELETEEAFDRFKEVFAPLHPELEALTFEQITGKVKAEFEYGEMKWVIELVETELVSECKDGENETEEQNLELEIEADYEAEEGELVLEGSHFLLGADGEIEQELDFIAESGYEAQDDELIVTFFRVVDEDHYKEGEELFSRTNGISFTLKKD